MGNAAVPLVLIGIGAAIYKSARGMWSNLFDVFYLSAVRLIFLPLIFILILKLLPMPEEIFRVLVVTSLMPVSSSSVLVARRYGGDMELASQAIVISTVLSIFTAPLMLMIIL
jgi:predicted permease